MGCFPNLRMSAQHSQPLASTLNQLDQLTGRLVTAVAGLKPEMLDETLMNALQQIAEALHAEQATFESAPNGQTDRALRRTWLRPEGATVREPELVVLESLPSGYSQVLSVAGGGQPWPAPVTERLRPIVDLLGLAVHRCQQSRELDLLRFELADALASAQTPGGTLEAVERRHIEDALRKARWRINGPGNAAEVLGLHPNTLRFRMKKLRIQRPPQASTLPFAQTSQRVTSGEWPPQRAFRVVVGS